ncbi:AlpA family phage regulatory protein [uncultured Ruegeria sp.]|uniref:AlpA family phage regulatory protein n=1 Tax=uncultured Ruegeria sp. TaxID=259304 RepID=UPI00147C2CCE|nr:AlpA family phage regulatory protein [uncultured Ruegeria sp.]
MTERILRRPEVELVTGISRSTIYEKMNPKSAYFDASFPTPVRLGPKSVGWKETEIQSWISTLSEVAA